jgi:hypothetical protein
VAFLFDMRSNLRSPDDLRPQVVPERHLAEIRTGGPAAGNGRVIWMSRAVAGAEVSVLRLLEPQGRLILVPFDKRECMTLKQAADVAGKSESTKRGWAEVHGLGRRFGGGTWSISRVALVMFLDGQERALRAYHAGDRATDLVAGYFARVGLADMVDA